MAAPGDPPEVPDGIGGADDEYRSVVFDEDFVRAARLQEYSAQERLGEHSRAVRSRSMWGAGSGGSAGVRRGRQGLLLVLVIALAFGAAVFMGLRHPYVPRPVSHTDPLSMTVVPLAPQGPVPGGRPGELYEASPAAGFRVGAAGITLPAVRRTAHFSAEQVLAALSTAKDYLVQSSFDPDVLTGAATRPVRMLIDPDQVTQFDESLSSPAADGRHAATGWLVRFDPGTALVADSRVRVSGTMSFAEAGPDMLEVATDHTFVYAVRPAVPGPQADAARPATASLFTVRRELRLRFDREDLEVRRAELFSAAVLAGPMDCAADPSAAFRPLLAGERATGTGPAATDPFRAGHPNTGAGLCGVLAATAQPSPAPPRR
ncbi:SCO2583 family membrane protein [Streptomyces sp. NPDC002073]